MSNRYPTDEAKSIPLNAAPWARASRVIGPRNQGPKPPTLRLVSLTGAGVVEIRQFEVVIGRHSNADWQLPQLDVSRRHCRLYFTNGHWHIADLGSLNGTLVNGERVEKCWLHQDDVIRVGGHMFVADLGSTVRGATEADRSEGILRSIAALLPDEPPKTAKRRTA